ncbi:MAG: AAA family ATPase, partial [Candidatus Aenigmarchaeota archaeon]|nr:AAA family ATPase [Candidatus Aenigmarchaeota archaeon]
FWDEIIDIKELEPPEWVYDLEVDETHNYVANDFFVHNSNIIDGLTFILGTTSARLIRAQKLQNLIFNGGKDRKPADFCEVSIYLDNSDGKIPGDAKEMKITRRITRSGISIYKMDGHTVTRSKVIDTISYAGLSPEGHNIILQGDVTNIIQMNPKERRQIIDDISGIAEFDDKKSKATSELEKVETRVRENMIVVAEKQRLVARLKEEKETAEKYKKLEQEMKSAKASAFKRKYEDAQEKMAALEKEISSGSADFDKMEKEFDKLEKELEEKERAVLKKSDVLVKKSKNYDLQRQIDSFQTDMIRKKDRIDLYEREITRLRSESDDPSVREILAQNWDGVHGKFIDLVKIPKKFSTAMFVAIGKHANDIVVDDENIAANCIRHLKERKIGTARFVPLSIIRGREKREYKGPERLIGYAIDIIEFERKYQKAAEFVIGNTLVVDNIDTAKRIRNFRIVTLDGDLVEESGAMIGGFLSRKQHSSSNASIAQIQEGMNKLLAEINNSEKEVEKLKDQLEDEGEEMNKLQQSAGQDEKLLDELRKKRKELYEQRLRSQGDVGKKKIEKARLEATLDNMNLEVKEHEGIALIKGSLEELEEKSRRCIIEINKLGPVNMKALDEYGTLNIEFEELRKKLDKLLEEKDAIMAVVQDVEKKRYDKFMETMNSINKFFAQIYTDLTGGEGRLRLEEENNIESGLLIEASPSGKKILNLDSMSGGEKSMTSLAFLFSILQHYASPFYVLDEVDAALDKANTKRVMSLVKRYSSTVQFIVISHSDTTIAEADKVYGVSMENGISKVFGIDLHGQHTEIETKEEPEEASPQQ